MVSDAFVDGKFEAVRIKSDNSIVDPIWINSVRHHSILHPESIRFLPQAHVQNSSAIQWELPVINRNMLQNLGRKSRFNPHSHRLNHSSILYRNPSVRRLRAE
jgi:hypothetical protein